MALALNNQKRVDMPLNKETKLCRLFNVKAILLEEQLWYYLTHTWEDKGVHTFPNGICPKVNVIARLEYEPAFYDSAVHRFNHYTTNTPPSLPRCSKVTLLNGISTFVGYLTPNGSL